MNFLKINHRNGKLKVVTSSLVILAVMLIINSFLDTTSGIAFAIETERNLDISIYPTNKLLNAPNLAPGDKISNDLTVKNQGDIDFYYNISVRKESGSDLLYNSLELELKDSSEKSLFKGKLKEFTNCKIGNLIKGQTDVLNFTVSLPSELGNEYQGLELSATFTVKANN